MGARTSAGAHDCLLRRWWPGCSSCPLARRRSPTADEARPPRARRGRRGAGEALQRQRRREPAGKPRPRPLDPRAHAVSTQNSIAAAAENAVNDGADLGRPPTLPTGLRRRRGDRRHQRGDRGRLRARRYGVRRAQDRRRSSPSTTTPAPARSRPRRPRPTSPTSARQVNNYWDRGLTGIAVDPQFGTAGHNYVYVSYTYNRDPRDNPPVVPKWGNPGQAYDDCPSAGRPQTTRHHGLHRDGAGHPAHGAEARRPTAGRWCPAPRRSCWPAAASSSAATPRATSPSARTASSTPRPATARASTPTTTASSPTRAATRATRAARCAPRTTAAPATRSASTARSSGWTRTAAFAPTQAHRQPVAGRLRPAQPVAAHLPARAPRARGPATSAPARGRRSTGSPTSRPVSTPDQPGLALLRGQLHRLGRAAGLGRARQAAVREPLRAGHRRRSRRPTSATRPAAASCSPPARTATTRPRRSPASRSRRRPATTRRRTRARCSSPTSPAPASGCSGKKPNGDPDPTDIQPFVQAAETPVDLMTGPGGDLYYVDYGLNDEGVPTENGAGVHRIVYTGQQRHADRADRRATRRPARRR